MTQSFLHTVFSFLISFLPFSILVMFSFTWLNPLVLSQLMFLFPLKFEIHACISLFFTLYAYGPTATVTYILIMSDLLLWVLF
jgi:hypothetical protein